MMKNLVATSVFLCSSLAFAGNNVSAEQQNECGEKVTERRFEADEIREIKKIKADKCVTVVANDSDNPGVDVSGDASVVRKVKTEIEGNTLHVYLDSKRKNNEDFVVNIALGSQLTEVNVASSSEIEINHKSNEPISISVSESSILKGSISSSNVIDLNVSQSSEFTGTLTSDTLTISSWKSSEVALEGSSKINSVNCKKSSQVDLIKFNNDNPNVRFESDISSEVKLPAKQ